jgi:hypothetical protein
MKKLTAVDWQSFSLKKDIENILKKISETRGLQISIALEFALAVFSISLNQIFDNKPELNLYWWWWCVAISSIVIVLMPFVWQFIKSRKEIRNTENGIATPMVVKRLIDSFDNEVCYYALMAESYYEAFRNLLSDPNTSQHVRQFYFIETGYYLNKTILELCPIYKSSTNVFSSDIGDIVSKRKVSYARYYNIYNILKDIYKYLEDHLNDLDGLKDSALIIEANQEFEKKLDIFDSIVRQ